MIQVRQLHLRLGAFQISDLNLEIESGCYAVLMGRSGCGKTSLLEAIGGLRPIQQGTIQVAGKDVTKLKPAERGVGYVPQDRALFPTLRVRDQLAFSLVLRKLPSKQIGRRVQELAELLEITPLLDRMPQGLSGGESQRVALGRALAFQPKVLLLDEPLSALDEDLHQGMCSLLRQIHEHTQATILHITHSAQEAKQLAARRYRMENGKILAPPKSDGA